MHRSILTACLGIALCLSTGCGEDDPSIIGETLTVSGHIEKFSGGTGYTLNAFLIAGPNLSPSVGQGTLDGTGNFGITLHGGAALQPYLGHLQDGSGGPIPCQSTISYSPPDGKLATLMLAPTKGTALAPLTETGSQEPGKTLAAAYFYADQNMHIDGELTCDAGTGIATHNSYNGLRLYAGWNLILETTQIIQQGNKSTLDVAVQYGGSLPFNFQWFCGKPDQACNLQ